MNNNRLLPGPLSLQTLASSLFVAFCALGLFLSLRLFGDFSAVARLQTQPAGAAQAQQVSGRTFQAASPDRLVAYAMQLPVEDGESLEEATALVENALQKNPDMPFAWALLAYFDSRSENGLGERGLEALRESYSRCLVCNRELIHWRLEFVLANWPKVTEDIRMSAFESADFLRWWYLEYEYLADLRTAAQGAGIPFAAYQRKINTPVRPNELPLAED